MTERELFKQTFDAIHASKDTVTEVMKMAKSDNIYPTPRKKRHPVRTLALIAAAAVLLVTGAFAAAELFGLRTEPVGQYGMKISADYSDETAANGDAIAFTGGDPAQTHCIDIAPTWLPDGMENVIGETWKFWFADNHQSGISFGQSPLNTGKATFCELLTGVETQESLTVSGHEAIYFPDRGKLYVSYPEFNAVLTADIMEMDFDDALRIVEGLSVTQSDDVWPDLDYMTYLYQAAAEGRDGLGDDVMETADGYVKVESSAEMSYVDEDGWTVTNNGNDVYKTAISKGEMNAYAIGETVSARFGAQYLPVTVKDVAVSNDLSILIDPSLADSDLTGLLDESGKLPFTTVKFYQTGDGINTPSATLVGTQEAQVKLVTATIDITNNTPQDLQDVCYFFSLISIAETEDGYEIYTRELSGGTLYDYSDAARYVDGGWEMRYNSIKDNGTHNGSNYINSLAAGETVTLQVGWLVTEDQLPYLYLNLNGYSLGSRFWKPDVEQGYIKLFE